MDIKQKKEEEIDQEIKAIMKRTKKIMIFIVLSIFFISILLLSYAFNKLDYIVSEESRHIVVSNSPNEINQIAIDARGLKSIVRISYGKKDKLDNYKESTIQNRGKTLQPSNFKIEWKNDNHAIITLSGEEQENEIIRIDFRQ